MWGYNLAARNLGIRHTVQQDLPVQQDLKVSQVRRDRSVQSVQQELHLQ